MNWRQILLIVGLIVLAIAIGVVLYVIFFAPIAPPPPVIRPAPPPVTGVLPPAGLAPPAEIAPPPTPFVPVVPPVRPSEVARGGVTKVSYAVQAPILDPAPSTEKGALNYYDRIQGKFFKISADGKVTTLSEKTFPQARRVAWSPNKNQSIIEFPDGFNVLYNFETEEQITLPIHWRDFKFSGTGESIAFKSFGTDLENRWLAVSSPDGDKVKLVESLGNRAERLAVNWSPNNQIVATFTENIDSDRSELFFVGQNDENFKSTTLEGHGFVGQWSPKGDRILYSVHSARTDELPELWIVDADGNDIGKNKRVIGLQTWADKCVFSVDNVNAFCAVPYALPPGAGIIRAVAEKTPDAFYKVNTLTGAFELISLPDALVTAVNLIMSPDESQIYFVDKQTDYLASLKIK